MLKTVDVINIKITGHEIKYSIQMLTWLLYHSWFSQFYKYPVLYKTTVTLDVKTVVLMNISSQKWSCHICLNELHKALSKIDTIIGKAIRRKLLSIAIYSKRRPDSFFDSKRAQWTGMQSGIQRSCLKWQKNLLSHKIYIKSLLVFWFYSESK